MCGINQPGLYTPVVHPSMLEDQVPTIVQSFSVLCLSDSPHFRESVTILNELYFCLRFLSHVTLSYSRAYISCLSVITLIPFRIITSAEAARNPAPSSIFPSSNNVSELFSSKEGVKTSLKRLWQEELDEVKLSQSLFPQLGNEGIRRSAALALKKYDLIQRTVKRNWENAVRGKNLKKIRRRIEKLHRTAEAKADRVFGTDDQPKDADVRDHQDSLRLRALAFHPSLISFNPELTKAQTEIARSRVLGYDLTEADVWLLRNIWATLRQGPYPIPVMIRARQTTVKRGQNSSGEAEVERSGSVNTSNESLNMSLSIDHQFGFLEIPFDFEVWQFADFLEEHLDKLREARRHVVEQYRRLFQKVKK